MPGLSAEAPSLSCNGSHGVPLHVGGLETEMSIDSSRVKAIG